MHRSSVNSFGSTKDDFNDSWFTIGCFHTLLCSANISSIVCFMTQIDLVIEYINGECQVHILTHLASCNLDSIVALDTLGFHVLDLNRVLKEICSRFQKILNLI